MASYPRQTLAAITAALAAGGIGAYVIAGIVAQVITAQVVNTTQLNATSTAYLQQQQTTGTAAFIGDVTMQNASVTGTATIGTESVTGSASDTALTLNSGTQIKGHVSVSTGALSPSAIAPGQCTSTQTFPAAGAAAGDTVTISRPSAWIVSAFSLNAVASSGAVALTFCNTTDTTVTPTAAQTARIDDWQH